MIDPVFNVLIIGAGAIGALYDNPESEYILTHAHAFSIHSGFHLLGFVDVNYERAQNAARLWNSRAFKSLEEAFENERVDVACIAVPDELHYSILKKIAIFPLRAVFAEKPLTRTVGEAEEIVTIYRDRSIPICVNYRRSFVPEFEALQERIKGGTFGKYLAGTGYYGKGFLHSGSHLIHLLSFLIGEIGGHKIVASEIDFNPNDTSISVNIVFKPDNLFYLQHINCNYFTLFEADLLFEKGRVKITDTGFRIEYHTIDEHPILKGYICLAKTEEIDTQLGKSLYFSAINIYNHLTKEEPLKCSVYDAFKTMQICENIQANLSPQL